MSLYRKLVVFSTLLYAAEAQLEAARAEQKLHPGDKRIRKQFETALRKVVNASEARNRVRTELVEQAYTAARKEFIK